MSRPKRTNAQERRRERRAAEDEARRREDETFIARRVEHFATEDDPWATLGDGVGVEWDRGTPEHRQVRVQLDRRSAHVDEGMAELILACWGAGLWSTVASCQGWSLAAERFGEETAYLTFGDEADWVRFGVVLRDSSRVIAHGGPDADLAAAMANDPAAAQDLFAKGGGWAAYFPSGDIDAIAAAVTEGSEELRRMAVRTRSVAVAPEVADTQR